jgi:hypothetical protein
MHTFNLSRLPVATSIALLIASASSAAHPTWLKGEASDRTKVRLELTTSTDFPQLGSSSKPTSFQLATLFGQRFATPLMVRGVSASAVTLKGIAGAEPAAWAIVQLKPSDIRLGPTEVREYAKELHRPELLAQFAKDGQWRERFSKVAKAWVQLSDEAVSPEMFKPVNLPFELVPTSNPSLLAPGEVLTVCAYADGKVVTNVHVHLQTAELSQSAKAVDAKGCADFAKPNGDFLLHSTRLQRASQTDLEWQSTFTSLTVVSSALVVTQKRLANKQ